MKGSISLQAAEKRWRNSEIWRLNDGKRLAVLNVKKPGSYLITFLNVDTNEIEQYAEHHLLSRYNPKKTGTYMIVAEKPIKKVKKEDEHE